jgi:maltooligosyltrehalose trehalohydrolase
VHFLENHDQVANSAAGRRLSELSAPGQLRALTALLLLGPATPLLFQGQEIGSTAPFVYFAQHRGELARQVREGRLKFLGQFARFRTAGVQSRQRDPAATSSFLDCKISYEETGRSAQFWRLHVDLLGLRRADPAIAGQGELGLDGATLDDRSLIVRFTGAAGDDRLLVVNLGHDLNLATQAEPLVAPPVRRSWHVLWSSEDPVYGGSGTPQWTAEHWSVPGHSALLLGARPSADAAHAGADGDTHVAG